MLDSRALPVGATHRARAEVAAFAAAFDAAPQHMESEAPMVEAFGAFMKAAGLPGE